MQWWAGKKMLFESAWAGGFYAYDNYSPGIPVAEREMEIREEFFNMCAFLKAELEGASIDSN